MNRVSTERPFLIGLTGNIATGKSAVAAMLAELGAFTIDADKVAHQVMRRGTRVHSQIVESFGTQVLTDCGDVDRKRLGAIVFADERALARLEAIVHPATLEAIERLIATTSADVVVIEAIKLIESGLAERCDSVWVTTSLPEQQIERIMDTRSLSREGARTRVEAQKSQEERAARADVVIDNSGSLTKTRAQVLEAWRRVMERTSGFDESLEMSTPRV
ncbi:MAG: dephospho-CoA kinase [Anaerolineae bacterium]|jgi:dephospho-CoA kinase